MSEEILLPSRHGPAEGAAPSAESPAAPATARPRLGVPRSASPVDAPSDAPDAPLDGLLAVAAVVRPAVLLIGPDGRIAHWDEAAAEVFGPSPEQALGRSAATLVRCPPKQPPVAAASRRGEPAGGRGGRAARGGRGVRPEDAGQGVLARVLDRLATDPAHPAWAGALTVPGGDGEARRVLCWAYGTEGGVLVLAADAGRLRAEGPRLALGPDALPCAALRPTAGGPRLDAELAAPAAAPGPALAACAAFLPPVPSVPVPSVPAPARASAPADPPDPAPPTASSPTASSPAASSPAATAALIARLGAPLLRLDRRLAVPLRPDPADPGGACPFREPPFLGPVPTPVLMVSDSATVTEIPAEDEQLGLLHGFSGQVGTTLDLATTVQELCEAVVPDTADLALVDLVDRLATDYELDPREEELTDGTPLRRMTVVGLDRLRLPGRLGEGPLAPGVRLTVPRATPQGLALQTNQPVLVPVLDAAVTAELAAALEAPELEEALIGYSFLALPLAARGTVLGFLGLVRHPDRPPFDHQDTAYLREFAARAALSIDNARLHAKEARAASLLQRSMLPDSPPLIPGVAIAHRYLPGDPTAEVGGDWFDAVRLPGSRVALVVGDVMGHGLQSAAAMGRFRTAMQTLAELDLPPAQILRHLDNISQRLGPEHLATCLYAVYDPIARTCTLAGAGHVPPVLVHPDGRGELLDIPSGAPIGVGGVPFETTEISVEDGSMLVLCTDGLVEVRGGDIGDSLAALCGDVVDPTRPPDEVCDTVLERLGRADRKDDLALLVARFDGIDPSDVAAWPLRVENSEVPRARRLVAEQLAAWGLSELSDTAQLLVSELVTNALLVAGQEIRLQLTRVDKLLVEVTDDDHNLPSLVTSRPTDVSGRGLGLVSQLSRRWGTNRRAVGKVVWFELPLPR